MESDAEEDLAMPHVSGGVIGKVRKIFACVWSYRKIFWTTKIILTSLECLGEMSLNNLNPLAYSSQHKFTATGIFIAPPPPPPPNFDGREGGGWEILQMVRKGRGWRFWKIRCGWTKGGGKFLLVGVNILHSAT